MFKKTLTGFLLFASIAMVNTVVFANSVPTLHQVFETVQAGQLDKAQQMMTVVLQAHPDSAKAHFVEAEILAKEGQMGSAKTELATAQRLEPGLPFAKPASVHDLQSRIASSPSLQAMNTAAPRSAGTSFPWGLMLFGMGAIILVYFVIKAFSSRNNATAMPGRYLSGGMQGGNATAQPYGGGMAPMGGGMAPMGGGMGSGIMSGLVTGAAVGAGVVAGEELAHHFLDGSNNQAGSSSGSDTWDSSSNNDNMGGSDFGVTDNSSWDDSSNTSDNSSFGGDDWS